MSMTMTEKLERLEAAYVEAADRERPAPTVWDLAVILGVSVGTVRRWQTLLQKKNATRAQPLRKTIQIPYQRGL